MPYILGTPNEISVESLSKLYEDYKYNWCKDRGYDPKLIDENGINGECYACFQEWLQNDSGLIVKKDKIVIEFYWKDLTKEKQDEILNLLGENCNWDSIPFCTLEIEKD